MKKIGLIVLALVIALGSLGAGYAYWSQSLDINGTVNMGNLSAIFVDAAVYGSQDPNGGPGTCTPSIINDGQTLKIVIDNAYPAYNVWVRFDILNNGDIPVCVSTGAIEITAPEDGSAINGEDIQVLVDVPSNKLNPTLKLGANVASNFPQINVYIPFSSTPGVGPVEDGVYTVYIPLVARQWNAPAPTTPALP